MTAVVGRDRELAEIASFLDLSNGGARVLLIEGEAGIGKTTLWRAGVDEASRLGYRVLACAGAASETQLSFTAFRDVLGDAFDDIADELPPPQRHALEVALLRTEPTGRPADPGAVAVGLLGTLRLLAARGPTLLAVDDLQWIDKASAAPLEYALRRLHSERVAVLLARRADDPETLEPSGLEAGRVRPLRLSALSVGALGRVLHERLGQTYPRPTLHRLHEVSGGNVFYALELARALGDPAQPLRLGEALPVPSNLLELVKNRVGALPTRTFDVLAIASALARPTVQTIGAALGVDAAPLLEPAVGAQVVETDGEAVWFAHPLFAAAVYALAALRRSALHARLAELVPDVEERARHLSLATDEAAEEIARLVEQGATAAFERGSPAAAAELAAHARRLTPASETDATERRALAEVDYLFEAGDTIRAVRLIDELLAERTAGPFRGRLLNRKARIYIVRDNVGESLSLLRDALVEAGDEGPLRAEIEEGLAWASLLARRDLHAAALHARSARRSAEERGDRAMLAESLGAEALIQFVLGQPWEEAMNRALALEPSLLGVRVLRHPSFAHGFCLLGADELERARVVYEELERRAIAAGDEGSRPAIYNRRATVEWLAGDWETASRYAEEGYELALEAGQPPNQVSTLGKTALVALSRGALDKARDTASRALALAGGPAFDPARPERAMERAGETAIWALGLLELSEGNAENAHRFLGPLCEALLAAGIQEPGEMRCLPDEIEALVALERFDEAERYLRQLESWAERLGRRSTLAVAGRCRGLLLAGTGDLAGAQSALEVAAALHEGVPIPFERARTLFALGSVERRSRRRRAARDSLNGALAAFEELGAKLWAEKTRAELARIGGRPPSSDELTPTEQRIAALVAEGKTNKEVAGILVVADRTVESALTQIYRKLDVRSRTELARKLTGLV